jgi:predicted permease
MIEFHGILTVQLFLLGLMLIGFATVKAGLLDASARSSITELILCVFLPATIVSSFFGSDLSQLPSLVGMIAISFGILLISLVLSLVLYRRVGKEQKKVLMYATLVTNASFMGNPVIESLFGLASMTYVAAYLIPFRVAIWTVGLAIFTGSGKGNIKKVALHPCMIATYLGFVVMATGFTAPEAVSRIVFSLGSCTAPLSMMMVGGILATVDLKKIISGLAVYYTVLRLALIPLLIMVILLALRVESTVLSISVLLCAMPAGATTSILAERYGADKELASRITFLSTVMSIVSIPLLFWLLQQF